MKRERIESARLAYTVYSSYACTVGSYVGPSLAFNSPAPVTRCAYCNRRYDQHEEYICSGCGAPT